MSDPRVPDLRVPDLRVTELWRYPVKSMLGEQLTEVDVGQHGMIGDRGWALFDTESGFHLTGRREPELLMASARLAGPTVEDGVIVTLPDGTETDDDQELSRWLGRSVTLAPAGSEVAGTFETPLDDTDEDGGWGQWTGPAGSFHDSTRTMVSLVSNATMGRWDRRRFRINVILDGSDEDSLVGSSLSLGTTRLHVTKQIARCVMVTRPQPAVDDESALDRDLDVLRTINRDRESLLGIGALVANPGRVALGDAIAAG